MSARREPQAGPTYRIECADPVGDVALVSVVGTLTFADGRGLWATLRATLFSLNRPTVRVELSRVESIDGGAMALLIQSKWDLQSTGVSCEFVGATGAVATILALYAGDALPTPQPPHLRIGLLGLVGDRTVALLREAQLFFAFVGETVLALGGVMRRPKTGNWRDIVPILTRTGAEAMPIVMLITFLIGFVMTFQSAVALKQFGANIYVADLVALSITRELGPLMTAIVISGRSGAAFAAELGTMKVSEEIDALRTMGIGAIRYLAFPRIVALVLALPVLTLLGDFVGILGGLLVGVLSLDLTPLAYLNQTVRALDLWDVFQGMLKAGFFGLALGLIACAQGLATTGGAEGVGRRTTASVVVSLFALIVIDAAFALAFNELGL